MKTNRRTLLPGSHRTALRSFVALALFTLFSIVSPADAALIDAWRADTLNFNDCDAASPWTSTSGLTATGNTGEQPTLKLNATPVGGRVVRFNGTQRLAVGSSPVGLRTAFSVAIVFKASAIGANNNAQWWGKSGIVDAEEPGVTSDWGTVINEAGQVGIGTGNG